MTNIIRQTAEGILYTDQYQLTMAQLYFRMGLHETPAQFDYFFRGNPDYGAHTSGYSINAGLEWLIGWMQDSRFKEEELAHLRSHTGQTGEPLFQEDFLDWLSENGHFGEISLQAIPEGRVVHPNVPVSVVRGPLAMAQILETPLLNMLNFQTLIATKACRIYESGGRRPLLEFGLRRAQGKGSLAGTRAALIGGAVQSSNVGISHVLGVQPAGTHAHSMVQAFTATGASELDAFRAFAAIYPNDCVLLVDTFDTLESGVPNAIKVFEELKLKGHRPVGIRLDSGDLAYLSILSAKMLNEAGFPDVTIILSNQLDELVLMQILAQIHMEAPRYGLEPEALIQRLIYGVGTALITSGGHPALDGVYKLVALKEGDSWKPVSKASENPEKAINPGFKNAWRIYDHDNLAQADVLALADEDLASADRFNLHHPTDPTKKRSIPAAEISRIEPLLVDILLAGKLVYELPSLEQIRRKRQEDISSLHPGVRRIVNPHLYHVSLTERLWTLKNSLLSEAKQVRSEPSA